MRSKEIIGKSDENHTKKCPLKEKRTEFPRVVKFLETESRRVVSRAWGGDNGELLFNGCGASV